MNKFIGDTVKQAFASLGLFIARQHNNQVTGNELEHDLKALLGDNAPVWRDPVWRGPVCFDIGANVGQTIQLLQRCYRSPRIFAFEPALATYAELSRQSFGSHVQCVQLVLGAEPGVQEFNNYGHSDLSSFLPLNPDKAENRFADEPIVSTERVQVDTLDQFCAKQGVDRIHLLKIDTQGFEMPVLRGGAGLFANQKVDVVMLELNFSALYEGQSDPLEIMQFLRSYHFRLIDFYEKFRTGQGDLSWTTALFKRHA